MSLLGVLILGAATVVTPPAPDGAADGEVSTNVVLSLRPDGNLFRLTVAVEAMPSNNVEIAFGVDRNADDDLATDETEFLIGWRGNRWVAFDTAGERIAEAFSPGGSTELRWTVRLRKDTEAPRALTALLDGSAAFAAWASNPPRSLFNPAWTHAKVFARGEGGATGRIALQRLNQGLALRIR